VLERSAQAIEPPDDQDVAFPYIRERILESRTTCLRPTGDILEDTIATSSAQRVALQLERLFPVEIRA
jgi:hypothetical protein